MLVRPFQPRDAADLGRVFYRSVHEVGATRYSPSQVEVWAPGVPSEDSYIERSKDGRVFLVAVDERDRPQAYGDLTPDGHIDYLYCAPEATRTGVVEALYLQLEQAAIKQSVKVISTHASELARSFFEKRAFLVVQQLGGPKGYTCARCGLYAVLNEKRSPFPDQLRYFLEAQGANVALRRSRLSHVVRRAQDGRRYIGIPVNDIGSWGLDDPLPSPGEQFDNLVLWTGDHQPNYAGSVTIRPPEMAAWMGAPVGVNPSQIMGWILAQGGAGDLIEQRMEALRLTLKGWERYRTLKDTVTASRAAFMAMKFGDEQLNAAVETCFKPAVSAAGFELRTIAEGQSAGLIDDQIRVAIRRSKFVVADLTHGNNGAYWEAGFAEGAGKPVIYTCHADAWSKEKTHFDTNHLATIIWHPEELPDVGRRLKAMIQATFPADAKME